jgi:5'(3')-deoxyribonucleotidase
MKKIVYIDMDGVLVNFTSGIERVPEYLKEKYKNDLDEVPGIFSMMDPMDSAINSYHRLCKKYDVYILSTAPWKNPLAFSDKVVWIQRYLGESAHKKLILSAHKNLNVGDYLIDDRLKNGAGEFTGEHLHFGTDKFPDWESVCNYLGV